jgi:hypothetical protein
VKIASLVLVGLGICLFILSLLNTGAPGMPPEIEEEMARLSSQAVSQREAIAIGQDPQAQKKAEEAQKRLEEITAPQEKATADRAARKVMFWWSGLGSVLLGAGLFFVQRIIQNQ